MLVFKEMGLQTQLDQLIFSLLPASVLVKASV